MKNALITGVAGQDGSYLAEFLLAKGYEVFGVVKPGSGVRYVPKAVIMLSGDLTDRESIKNAVKESTPDEVYNLGGVTDLKTAYAEPEMTWKVNYESVGILLDECLNVNPSVRFLQASSMEIFLPSESPLNEDSPRDWDTKNPYAKAKMMADRDFIARSRKEKNAFCCSAILSSHESPRRPEINVLRKISRTLVKIKLGMVSSLSIGNVEMRRDWGFAGDYVQAMWKMLQQETPEDFVIATGQAHQVKEAIDIAAQCLGMGLVWQGKGAQAFACDLTGQKIVEVVPEFYKPTESNPKIGDRQKAEKVLGWKPTVDFRSLVQMMVQSDLTELRG